MPCNIYTSEKIICTPLLNPVMYEHLSLFESKQVYVINRPLFPILKRSTSIKKNNPALVVSIVLQKHYFYGICVFSKKKQIISRVLVRSVLSKEGKGAI